MNHGLARILHFLSRNNYCLVLCSNGKLSAGGIGSPYRERIMVR